MVHWICPRGLQPRERRNLGYIASPPPIFSDTLRLIVACPEPLPEYDISVFNPLDNS